MYFARTTSLFLIFSLLHASFANPIPPQPSTNAAECMESSSELLCNNAVDVTMVETTPVVKCPEGFEAESCIDTPTGLKPAPTPIISIQEELASPRDEASLIPTPPDMTTRFAIPTIIILSFLSVIGITYGIYKSQAVPASLPAIRQHISSIRIPQVPIRKYLPIPTTWRMSESRLVKWAQEDMGLLDITDEDFEQGISSNRYPKYEFELEEPKYQKRSPSAYTNLGSRGQFVNYGSAWN